MMLDGDDQRRIRSHAPQCMGCGDENPSSFGLRISFGDDGRVHGLVTFDERHTGAPGFAHGGAVAAVLDDLLGQVLIVLDRPAVTASLQVDFRAPTFLERELQLVAWCEYTDGRKLHLRAEACDGERLVAEARALFIAVKPTHWHRDDGPFDDMWMARGAA